MTPRIQFPTDRPRCAWASHGRQRPRENRRRQPVCFKNVSTVRLLPGRYCITSVGFLSDAQISTGRNRGSVIAGDSGGGAVLITDALSGGNGLLSSTIGTGGPGHLVAGATFLFDVVPAAPVPVPQNEFVDCEAVACAGLKSGEYNVQGEVRFCDNDVAGGGWLRLWRVNETSCEANGWSSARNQAAVGIDPPGCRPTTTACLGNRITAPFQFAEVRGSNWLVWALGTPDAFESMHPCDGVVVRDGSGAQVWALAVGNPLHPTLITCARAIRSLSTRR